MIVVLQMILYIMFTDIKFGVPEPIANSDKLQTFHFHRPPAHA